MTRLLEQPDSEVPLGAGADRASRLTVQCRPLPRTWVIAIYAL